MAYIEHHPPQKPNNTYCKHGSNVPDLVLPFGDFRLVMWASVTQLVMMHYAGPQG